MSSNYSQKYNSGDSNEEEEDEEEEESEEEDSSTSEDEEMLNRLRFKRKIKTIDTFMNYKAAMVKLEPEVSRKDKIKENIRRKNIICKYV